MCVPQTPTKYSLVRWKHPSVPLYFVTALCSVEEPDIDFFLCFPLGGADKNVVVFDKSEEQIVVTLKGHAKKVTSVIFHPSQVVLSHFLAHFLWQKIHADKCANKKVPFLTLLSSLPQSMVFSASPDATIRVWSVTGGNCVQVVRAHEAGVTGLSLHATGDYLLSSSEDQVCFQLKPLLKPKNPPLSCFILLTLFLFFVSVLGLFWYSNW